MQIRRSVAAAFAALVLASAGCATDPSMPAGEIATAPVALPAGSVLTYATFNAYNDEPRATVRQVFGPAGSRIEGMDYQIPAENAFGINRAIFVNRVLDAQGNIVRLERADGSSVTYDPPMRVLPFPLRPGARFSQAVTARESDGSRPRRVIVTGYVAGWETVKVPAGEFRALRVVRDTFLGDERFYRTQTTRKEVDWYAPSVGAVVRSHEDSFNEDTMSGGGESGGTLVYQGDWLRWELQSVSRTGGSR
ncbi:MAG: hypothetical protein K2W80_09685 [Burkholderiales bacterium]|jgi:hypothetical protein|nr:hypothetical protein [Burkholderiales bacterium]